jgi:hypothetical protein
MWRLALYFYILKGIIIWDVSIHHDNINKIKVIGEA